MTSIFFGHSNCPARVLPVLTRVLKDLIEQEGVDRFYVGNQGSFDDYALQALRSLSRQYPHIRYQVVLAYVPGRRGEWHPFRDDETLLPAGIERLPRRAAIPFRNRWLIEQADCVVAYVTRTGGGAAQYLALAKKKGKSCINLADDPALQK